MRLDFSYTDSHTLQLKSITCNRPADDKEHLSKKNDFILNNTCTYYTELVKR